MSRFRFALRRFARLRSFSSWLAGALCALGANTAWASPRPLPFTYQHEQLSKGEGELELFTDLTPVRARSASSGDPRWYGLVEYQAEIEIGLSDRLEMALYLTLVPPAGTGFSDVPRGVNATGVKQRLRYQLAPTGEWPIDVGVYGELVENEREFEIEGKVLLQRRLGALRLMANAGAERELYYDGTREIVLNPSAGMTYEVSPAFQPGIEWWMRGEFPEENPPSPRPFALGPHHYVGPTAMMLFGKIWWSAGVYYRIADHTMRPGEGFGKVWGRSVIGIEL